MVDVALQRLEVFAQVAVEVNEGLASRAGVVRDGVAAAAEALRGRADDQVRVACGVAERKRVHERMNHPVYDEQSPLDVPQVRKL